MLLASGEDHIASPKESNGTTYSEEKYASRKHKDTQEKSNYLDEC